MFFLELVLTYIYRFLPLFNKLMCGCDSYAIHLMQNICLDEVGGEKAVDASTQETTLIHHIFGGLLQSQVEVLLLGSVII